MHAVVDDLDQLAVADGFGLAVLGNLHVAGDVVVHTGVIQVNPDFRILGQGIGRLGEGRDHLFFGLRAFLRHGSQLLGHGHAPDHLRQFGQHAVQPFLGDRNDKHVLRGRERFRRFSHFLRLDVHHEALQSGHQRLEVRLADQLHDRADGILPELPVELLETVDVLLTDFAIGDRLVDQLIHQLLYLGPGHLDDLVPQQVGRGVQVLVRVSHLRVHGFILAQQQRKPALSLVFRGLEGHAEPDGVQQLLHHGGLIRRHLSHGHGQIADLDVQVHDFFLSLQHIFRREILLRCRLKHGSRRGYGRFFGAGENRHCQHQHRQNQG